MAGAESSTRVGSGRNRGKILNNAYYFAKLEKKPRKKTEAGNTKFRRREVWTPYLPSLPRIQATSCMM